MAVCKPSHKGKPLATIVKTLENVFRTDPVIPEAMLAVLRTLDLSATLSAAPARGQKPLSL